MGVSISFWRLVVVFHYSNPFRSVAYASMGSEALEGAAKKIKQRYSSPKMGKRIVLGPSSLLYIFSSMVDWPERPRG